MDTHKHVLSPGNAVWDDPVSAERALLGVGQHPVALASEFDEEGEGEVTHPLSEGHLKSSEGDSGKCNHFIIHHSLASKSAQSGTIKLGQSSLPCNRTTYAEVAYCLGLYCYLCALSVI